jgi:hypothetical protein
MEGPSLGAALLVCASDFLGFSVDAELGRRPPSLRGFTDDLAFHHLSGIKAHCADTADIAAMLRAMTNTALAGEIEPPSAVPAAWPTGFARLGVTVTCERCDVLDACDDWRATAPVESGRPAFCPDSLTS